MKRLLFVSVLLLALLSSCMFLSVAAAEDYTFATLNYETADGTASGVLAKESEFSCGVTLRCDAQRATLSLDGVSVEGDSVTLVNAGRYQVTVTAREGGATFLYTVTILPRVNLYDGQVFTTYPTIECENVSRIVLDRNYNTPISSGTTVTELGVHELEITGNNYIFKFTFYVSACAATFGFDESLGQYALRLEVGDFEGVCVTLDGTTELTPGTHRVTAVGQHTVTATQNGEPLTAAGALPSADELLVQVRLILSNMVSDEPFYFRLSRWDASFYLDGERVEGDLRIERHGTHELEVRDGEGNVIKHAFRVFSTEEDKGHNETVLTLTFDNPHRTYATFVIVPAVLLLLLAAAFVFLRRRIV